MSRVPWHVIVGLIVANTLAMLATWVWFYALQYHDGHVSVCVDCLGEGLVEVVLLFAAWVVSAVALAWAALGRVAN